MLGWGREEHEAKWCAKITATPEAERGERMRMDEKGRATVMCQEWFDRVAPHCATRNVRTDFEKS